MNAVRRSWVARRRQERCDGESHRCLLSYAHAPTPAATVASKSACIPGSNRRFVSDRLNRVPLFGHSHDDATGGESDAVADADQVKASLDHFAGLSLSQRSAEVLAGVATTIDQTDDPSDAGAPDLPMDGLLASWLPDRNWMDITPEQRGTWFSLQLILDEAFQALVLARLLVCHEATDNRQGTNAAYFISPDGRAALGRGDVADVVTRRLPD